MSIKDECARAGQRMGARLRLFGETASVTMTKEEKIAFWSAVLDELADVFDDLTPDDAHRKTRH